MLQKYCEFFSEVLGDRLMKVYSHWKLIELYGANSSCMYLAVACVTGVIIRVAIDPDMSNGLFASVLGSPLLYPFATLSYTGYLFSYVASLDIVLLYNYFGIWQRQVRQTASTKLYLTPDPCNTALHLGIHKDIRALHGYPITVRFSSKRTHRASLHETALRISITRASLHTACTRINCLHSSNST
jgi:hypothetical protein